MLRTAGWQPLMARASAAIWSGVVPQQPPTRFAPAATISSCHGGKVVRGGAVDVATIKVFRETAVGVGADRLVRQRRQPFDHLEQFQRPGAAVGPDHVGTDRLHRLAETLDRAAVAASSPLQKGHRGTDRQSGFAGEPSPPASTAGAKKRFPAAGNRHPLLPVPGTGCERSPPSRRPKFALLSFDRYQRTDRTGHQHCTSGRLTGNSGAGQVDLRHLVPQPDGGQFGSSWRQRCWFRSPEHQPPRIRCASSATSAGRTRFRCSKLLSRLTPLA